MRFLLRPDPLPPHEIPDPGAQRIMQKIRHIEASHMQHPLRDLDKDTQPEPQEQDLPALPEPILHCRHQISQRDKKKDIQHDLHDHAPVLGKALDPVQSEAVSYLTIFRQWIQKGLHFQIVRADKQRDDQYRDDIKRQQHTHRVPVLHTGNQHGEPGDTDRDYQSYIIRKTHSTPLIKLWMNILYLIESAVCFQDLMVQHIDRVDIECDRMVL